MASLKEDVNTPLILTIGAISALLVIVTVVGLQAGYMYEEGREYDSKYANAVNTQLTELRTRQLANISTYHWVDKNKVAAVPIEQAMQVVIQNNGKVPATQPATQPK